MKWSRADNEQERVLALWHQCGGDIHGPVVETVTMPEEKFYTFLKRYTEHMAKKTSNRPIDTINIVCPNCKQDTDGRIVAHDITELVVICISCRHRHEIRKSDHGQ